ncbi:MAG TPA: glycosyltransferase [Caldilineaceae bacterium]|nr:glycosyltransferase [Caldilineaceae bacterium]
MRIVLFYHSLISDWNHGNAHFLRGIVTDLLARGHQVAVYEPRDGWSLDNLTREHGTRPVQDFQNAFPHLTSTLYDLATLDLEQVLAGADLVIVHEWNDPRLIRRVGEHRRRHKGYRLLFHDTHHRSLSDSQSIASYRLTDYDGVLAFGRVVRDRYLRQKWAKRAWVWHEAADTTVFHPIAGEEVEGDLVWVGNWGDEERSEQLHEYLFRPVRELGLRACIYGVRYPAHALDALREAGIEYRGWLPNYRAPQVFARFRLTVHVPRQPYVQALPGIPTIRIFEALACGIPLVCSPWHDVEGLFTPGKDYLVAADGVEMRRHLRYLLNEPAAARELAEHGLRTVQARHTCAHRVDELLAICDELGLDTAPLVATEASAKKGVGSRQWAGGQWDAKIG